jgi:hypothetical protein
MAAERRTTPRPQRERRQQHEFRLVIPRELRGGWLALQGAEKIRVAPIPDGWMALSDEELAVLVARTAARPNMES